MPEVRLPLSPEELRKRRSRAVRLDLSVDREYIASVPPGYAGYIYLGDVERKPTIKRHVTMAATQLGKKIKYLRSDDHDILVEVLVDASASGD